MIERFDPAAPRANYCHRVFADEHRRRYRLAGQAVLEHVGPSATVVDAACGVGYGFEYLGEFGRYVGLDGSVDALAECRRRYPAGDFRAEDLDGPCFLGIDPHAIVSLETVEHLEDPGTFLSLAHGALRRRDGLLVLSAPTSLTMDFDPFHRRDWPAWKWRDILRRAGFALLDEVPMPFTTTFAEFRGTVPVTWRQMARVAAYDLVHPRYLIDRLANWIVRGVFRWESTVFVAAAGSP